MGGAVKSCGFSIDAGSLQRKKNPGVVQLIDVAVGPVFLVVVNVKGVVRSLQPQKKPGGLQLVVVSLGVVVAVGAGLGLLLRALVVTGSVQCPNQPYFRQVTVTLVVVSEEVVVDVTGVVLSSRQVHQPGC